MKRQPAPPAPSTTLQLVYFELPAAAEPALEEFAALHELQLATWRHPEAAVCEVRVYCDDRKAAQRAVRLIKRELPPWLAEAAGALEATTAGAAVPLAPVISELLREDWTETWKRFFHTFRVSPRLVVKPAWESYAAAPGEIVLEIDPGMSFGTGYHGTTRACLEFIDLLSAKVPGAALFDVGTGSGILSMAAWKYGFRPVLACDNDPQAVGIAQENLARAGCAGVSVQPADLESFVPPQTFRVVVANILAPVLIQFAPRLVSFLTADSAPSYLILSGILNAQFAAVQEAFTKLGLKLGDSRTIDEWTSGWFVNRAKAQFQKYHGLGNDYLVLDPRTFAAAPMTPGVIRLICDRHFGLGSDGILWGPLSMTEAGAPAGTVADFGLRIFNPDGSEAEKSGNGLRIFARYLFDTAAVGAKPFTVWTKGGLVHCEVTADGGNVTVAMGGVSFHSARIPVTGPAREVLNESLTVGGQALRFCAATVGNPHCVVLCDRVTAEQAQTLGPALETDSRFPNRTNVQFLQVLDRHNIRIEIWERGAGYTLASGSSSCAAAAVAVRLGQCDSPVTVHMPGGTLTIALTPDYQLTLSGPVAAVATGTLADDLSKALLTV